MSQQTTQELPTPTPVSPSASSGPVPSDSGSTSPASGVLALVGHGLSAGLSCLALTKVLSWFPECLALVKLPGGGVTHDPWSWAPLVLDLCAAVAIAAPTSWRDLLGFLRGLRLPGRS
jgi:hypothetical protein